MLGGVIVKFDVSYSFSKMWDRVKRTTFFSQTGHGNDLAFYIFDYDAAAEIEVRKATIDFIDKVENILGHPVLYIDILDLMIEKLREFGVLEQAYKLQNTLNQQDFLNELNGLLGPDRIAEYIDQKVKQTNPDLVVLVGIGKSYPIARAHGILNNLHSKLDKKTMIMFYPGKYDQQSLHLFEEFKDNNYYRAFKMVD